MVSNFINSLTWLKRVITHKKNKHEIISFGFCWPFKWVCRLIAIWFNIRLSTLLSFVYSKNLIADGRIGIWYDLVLFKNFSGTLGRGRLPSFRRSSILHISNLSHLLLRWNGIVTTRVCRYLQVAWRLHRRPW